MTLETLQTTLRDTLTTNLEAAEAGVLDTPEQVRARDEAGRFARKEEVVEAKEVVKPEVQVQAEPKSAESAPNPLRPTTWKKEYLPLWDKAASGQPLTTEEWKKLAEYNSQRENEYKTGVSTYKAEAMQAREIQEAITPFLTSLQAHGVTPKDWIKQVGQAHQILAQGSPEQRVQMLHALAQRYGIPLQQQGQGLPPAVNALMQHNQQLQQRLAALEGKVVGVDSWRQQLESKALEDQVQKLSGNPAKYPHFEAVREQMAQLLEAGLAPDLDTAYDQAIYLNPEVRTQMLSAQPQVKVTTAREARVRAVSPKSATPSGQVNAGEAKDRRAQIAAALDEAAGGRV